MRYGFNRTVQHHIMEEKFIIIWTQFSLTGGLAEEEGWVATTIVRFIAIQLLFIGSSKKQSV